MTRKPKVGDKLRVTEDYVCGSLETKGTILEVISLRDNDNFRTNAKSQLALVDSWIFDSDYINNGLEFVDEISGAKFYKEAISEDKVKNLYESEKQMNQDYKFKVGDKGMTNEGMDYEIVYAGQTNVVAIVEGSESVYCSEGFSRISSSQLFPPSKRIQGWVNIYDSNLKPYTTKTVADSYASSGRVACIYIDVEEGEGL